METHGLEPLSAAGGLVVDVVSDLICPWCFVAKRRLERMGSLIGRWVAVRWHPFQLNPYMHMEGKNRRDYRSAKFGSWEYFTRPGTGNNPYATLCKLFRFD